VPRGTGTRPRVPHRAWPKGASPAGPLWAVDLNQ